jgi:hypothetical protein
MGGSSFLNELSNLPAFTFGLRTAFANTSRSVSESSEPSNSSSTRSAYPRAGASKSSASPNVVPLLL